MADFFTDTFHLFMENIRESGLLDVKDISETLFVLSLPNAKKHEHILVRLSKEQKGLIVCTRFLYDADRENAEACIQRLKDQGFTEGMRSELAFLDMKKDDPDAGYLAVMTGIDMYDFIGIGLDLENAVEAMYRALMDALINLMQDAATISDAIENQKLGDDE